MRLSVENLAGERDGRRIFSGVDFQLGEGQSLIVSGPNGAGKSTLLRILAGLLPSAEGLVRIDGWEPPSVAAACHYLGHLNAMKAVLTVTENLRFWRQFLGEKLLSTEDALSRVGLDGIAHLPFGYLSTGQQRRASIARLLTCRRPLWLLDEPTAGLDTSSQLQVSALMRDHLESGGMIVAATHLPLDLPGATELHLRAAAFA
jgi:heme exporter protein A